MIKLSRHVRSNMRLYKITENDIIVTVTSPDSSDMEGTRLTALKRFKNRFSGFPLKVVFKKDDEITIITAYPLKKKRWR